MPGIPQGADLTSLLKQMQSGDPQACQQAAELVYGEMHRIAARELRRERPDHLLQTTALIHEAYLRLMGSESLEIRNRVHFFAVASQQMRRILVDYARARDAGKRGGGAVGISVDSVQIGQNPRTIDLLLLDEALNELEQVEPRAAKIIELRYFGGYQDQEIAESLGVSVPTIRREWVYARSWLFQRMSGPGEHGPARPSA